MLPLFYFPITTTKIKIKDTRTTIKMSSEKTTITLVTGNANKLKEIVAILSNGKSVPSTEGATVGNYKIINKSIDLEEVQGTVDDVTIAKAKNAAKILNAPVLVEDTCLVFKAFNGLPGPYIKWFAKNLGLQGVINMLFKFEDKSAQAICTFGYCEGPDKPVKLFQGITEGKIVDQPRGPTNFGWDAIFEPVGYEQTYAELDKDVKNSISHRYKALAKVKEFLGN